jgi:hypothetical protein
VFLIALGLVLGNAACQTSTESPIPKRFLSHPVTAWISFDASTGLATVTPNQLSISVAKGEYPEWRPAPDDATNYEIDFIAAPSPDKCVGKPKPSKILPKPTCVKGTPCRTIKPGSDHYGCQAYAITLHRDQSHGGDVRTDPEIEVDR